MKYKVDGYCIERLDLIENDGTKIFLVDHWGSLDDVKPTIKETLCFIKEHIEYGKGLIIKEWTYDEKEDEFIGKLKRNKRGATAIIVELSKVIKRKISKKELEKEKIK